MAPGSLLGTLADRSRDLAPGVGSWLLLSVSLAVGSPAGSGPVESWIPDLPPAQVPYPDQFPLHPTVGNEPASGLVTLQQPWSPYGVSVSEDGRVRYQVTVDVRDLPESPGTFHCVWLTTPAFDPIIPLSAIPGSGRVRGETDGAQLVVVVSREEGGCAGGRWQGPVVLRGFSPGSRVQPMGTHSPFRPSPM